MMMIHLEKENKSTKLEISKKILKKFKGLEENISAQEEQQEKKLLNSVRKGKVNIQRRMEQLDYQSEVCTNVDYYKDIKYNGNMFH